MLPWKQPAENHQQAGLGGWGGGRVWDSKEIPHKSERNRSRVTQRETKGKIAIDGVDEGQSRGAEWERQTDGER